MKRPRISVVIPTLNEDQYLRRCLESLKKQSFRDFEIIVSDGGSRDTTISLAQKYGARAIVTLHSTVVQARQKGIDHAQGAIIVGADADTQYPTTHLQRIIDNFARSPDIVVVGGGGIFEPHPRWTLWGWKIVYAFLSTYYRVFGVVLYIPAFNLSFRRTIFETIGGYRTYLDFGGDELDILERMKKEGTVIFDQTLWAYPSSRRAKVGFFSLIFKHTLIDYYLNYVLAKIFRRPILRGKPVR